MPDQLTFRNTPCASCPYRRDVPSGIWHESEYDKLVDYDQDTALQPVAPFLCHDADRHSVLCRGWYETHGEDLLAVRLCRAMGKLDAEPPEACGVPRFESGQAAAEHGRRDIDKPGIAACRRIDKLQQKHPTLRK